MRMYNITTASQKIDSLVITNYAICNKIDFGKLSTMWLENDLRYIYSIYSQPITTRYMQIGTIEAKYKGKK